MPTYSIAIIGAGTSGCLSVQALQNLESEKFKFSIDLIERLPTLWGLLRNSVPPDHPKIKSVSKAFENEATTGYLNLIGNVEVGTDISLDVLKDKYDAVILAVGAPACKELAILGEKLANSISD